MMLFFLLLSTFLLGIAIGFKLFEYLRIAADKKADKEILDRLNRQYVEILDNLKNKKSKFKSRVNSTVYIESTLSDHGSIDILYMINNNDIAIFKDSNCIYTSHKVDRGLINDIISQIIKDYKSEIEDVVNILGMVFSKSEFERLFRVKFEDINISINEQSDIDKIMEDNNSRFDIDEILDKINQDGISSLSPNEKKYLEDYSKNG
jgi:hypothetical protein